MACLVVAGRPIQTPRRGTRPQAAPRPSQQAWPWGGPLTGRFGRRSVPSLVERGVRSLISKVSQTPCCSPLISIPSGKEESRRLCCRAPIANTLHLPFLFLFPVEETPAGAAGWKCPAKTLSQQANMQRLTLLRFRRVCFSGCMTPWERMPDPVWVWVLCREPLAQMATTTTKLSQCPSILARTIR